MKVFLSCPSRNRDIGIKIYEQLLPSELDILYFDAVVRADIAQPSDFKGVYDADALLVVITNQTITSLGVAMEFMIATRRQIPTFSLIVDENADIPQDLQETAKIKIDLNRLEASATEIIKRLQSLNQKDSETVLPPVPQNTPSARIFIAYSRKQRDIAKALSEFLGRNGKPHFWDAKIHAGATWRQTIQKALEDCTHLIVVWTKEASESDEVEREVSYALAKGKVIIPILSRDIPELPYHLYGFHYVVFDEDLSSIQNDLIRAIESVSNDDIWQ